MILQFINIFSKRVITYFFNLSTGLYSSSGTSIPSSSNSGGKR